MRYLIFVICCSGFILCSAFPGKYFMAPDGCVFKWYENLPISDIRISFQIVRPNRSKWNDIIWYFCSMMSRQLNNCPLIHVPLVGAWLTQLNTEFSHTSFLIENCGVQSLFNSTTAVDDKINTWNFFTAQIQRTNLWEDWLEQLKPVKYKEMIAYQPCLISFWNTFYM